MRNTATVIVAVLVLGLVGLFVRQYTSPFPWGVPTDRTLIKLFRTHRQTFETLVKMAEEDAGKASSNTNETLSVARRSEYSRLLSQIDSKMQMGWDSMTRVVFSSAHGGILLSIGPGWEKGIAYLTAGPSRVGAIVDNLDKDPGHDDVYLVPIEGAWYVFYQRTDYDRPPSE
jgi:hypothetical protein